MASVTMPETVQRHTPFLQKSRNHMREAPGLQGRAVSLGDDMPAIVRPNAEPEQFFGLHKPPAAQLFHGEGGQGDDSCAPALGFLLADVTRICLLGAGDNGELGAVQVNGFPP